MAMALGKLVIAAAAVGSLSACNVIYTSPSVEPTLSLQDSTGQLAVEVVPLTFESTAAANLTPYVPARLPLGFHPDAVRKAVARQAVPPAPISLPQPPTQPNARPGFIADRMPPPLAPQPYRIGVADVLLLAVNSSNATLDQLPGLITAQSSRQGFVVQDDGAIAVPGADRITVAGLTMEEAEAVIFQALVTAGIDPTFSLEIAEFNSQRVSIGGQVGQPALVPISLKPLYLHEAVDSAGGMTITDPRVAQIQIFRDGQMYQISANRFQSDPGVRQILMQDGDAVYVNADYEEERARAFFEEQVNISQLQRSAQQLTLQTAQINAQLADTELDRLRLEREIFKDRVELGAVRRDYAYLAGEVVRPARFPLPFESRAMLADVLFNERAININFGDYGEIYVLRRSTDPDEPNRLIAYHLDATNASNLVLASSMEMHGGDVVFVAEQPVTAWNRAISQLFPTLFNSLTSVAGNIAN
ncbi:MAG: polysaccharide biosynthesis/export family protein [Pseudomonadota bacterium]